MRSVAEQTSTIDSLRLAVLAALNIADEYHILKKKYDLLAGEYRQRAGALAGALDEALQEDRKAGKCQLNIVTKNKYPLLLLPSPLLFFSISTDNRPSN